MWTCGYCSKEFEFTRAVEKASHARWCTSNPKYEHYISLNRERNATEVMNARRKEIGHLNGAVKAKIEGRTYISPLKGRKNPHSKPHSDEVKEKIRQKALSSSHRRLKKGMVKYKDIWLDSSWEYELAKRLDELEIKWERPAPLTWIDLEGRSHHYFPDFYLVDFDMYLDPKNPAAYKSQKEKIEVLQNTYSNIRFLTTLEECKTFSLQM